MTLSPQPPRPRKLPVQARSRATFEAILEAATRILQAGGHSAITTNLVAETAGISVGSLYQYFPSKEAILSDLLGPLSKLLDGRNTCIPTRIHADGDFVIVAAKGQNQLKDGRRYDNAYCFVIKTRDGKLIETTEYLDTELVSDRLGKRA